MTESEEKNLKTQLVLSEEIMYADSMLLHTIQGVAKEVLEKSIRPKSFIKEGQETVELTVEEFTTIRVTLARLSSDDGFGELNSWIKEKYIEPKIEKKRIIQMLK